MKNSCVESINFINCVTEHSRMSSVKMFIIHQNNVLKHVVFWCSTWIVTHSDLSFSFIGVSDGIIRTVQKAPTDGITFIWFSVPIFSAWKLVMIFFRHQVLYKSLLVCRAIKCMMEKRRKHCYFVEERLTVTQVTEIMGGTCSMFWTIASPKIQLSLMAHLVILWGKYLEPRRTKEMNNLDYKAMSFLTHRSHLVLLWNRWGYHVLHMWHGWG